MLDMKEIKITESFGRVAVLMGGWSHEREISLQSGRAILSSLKRLDIDSFAVDVASGADIINLDCDRVLIALHGKGGEDGVIQGALEAMRIPYTGSGVLSSALSMNKLMCKRLWQQMRLPTPDFIELARGFSTEDVVNRLQLPLAVKPVVEGSSLGVSYVETADQLLMAWEEALRYRCPVMAERWIEGEEYAVSFLQNCILPPIKLEFSNHDFYDYKAKYEDDTTRYICSDILTIGEMANIQSLSYVAASALDITNWGRVDLRRDKEGKFWLLEVNTCPGMTSHSLMPKSAQAEGIDFDQLVLELLKTSLKGENGNE